MENFNDEKTKKQLAELKNFQELCKPLIKYLRENFTSNDAILITDNQAQIFRSQMSVPTKFKFE